MARKDERGVVIPAPLQFNNPASASQPRYDDEHRGPAVTDSYELSHCRIDLAERSEGWPTPANLPPRMVDFAQSVPEDQRADWLRRQANIEQADRHISNAMRSGELPIWVAPIGEPERLVAPGAIVEVDHATVVSGVYRPPNDRGWLYGRPLFVKRDDWAKFAARIDTAKKPARKNGNSQSRSHDGDERQWLRISKAVRILHRILRTRLAGQEPAPWIDPPADPFDAECENATHRHRRTVRTSLTMRRALLSGDLTAHLVKDGRSHPLPGWAWENASAAENAFNFNWLPLNPLLEHGLGEFGDWRCFVSRAEFKAWIARSEFAEIGDLPALPVPFDHDARPDQLTYREPPDRPFVELTQALTWIAFTVSLSRDEFSFMESCGFGPFAESGWPDGFRAAMAGFADQASAGNIRVRGRYVANYSDHTAAAQADTAYLTDTQLRDFACFDSLYGGLERGAGLVWETEVLERALEGRGDGWRDVEICRADVMRVFNREDDTARALTQPIPATLPDIGPVMGLDEVLSWLAHNRPSYDYQIWQNGAGEVEVRDPSGKVVELDEDRSTPQSIEDIRQASRHVHEALRDGDLAAYVSPRDGGPLRVPRAYWNGVNPESLHHVYRGMVPEDQGAGCPVLFSRNAFNKWRTQKNSAAARLGRGKVSTNRQLDHEKIKGRVREMRDEQPDLSIGSAAASIVAELPSNPKTGKPRDQRGIERIIAPLWEGKAE
ncbi:hypothetical protein [Sphingopyxis granuli]|uniref:hypothetical protein n=1 Tax=Sphingopyxis granuli TaxID=267128 RepID=UPI001BAF9F98|nr:hypothetical protein [Sphingopyxis granuli]QUM71119.1 hypothetical protein ICN83_12115 [Sphingopyxis granuli]